jgi:hypothetical protein
MGRQISSSPSRLVTIDTTTACWFWSGKRFQRCRDWQVLLTTFVINRPLENLQCNLYSVYRIPIFCRCHPVHRCIQVKKFHVPKSFLSLWIFRNGAHYVGLLSAHGAMPQKLERCRTIRSKCAGHIDDLLPRCPAHLNMFQALCNVLSHWFINLRFIDINRLSIRSAQAGLRCTAGIQRKLDLEAQSAPWEQYRPDWNGEYCWSRIQKMNYTTDSYYIRCS